MRKHLFLFFCSRKTDNFFSTHLKNLCINEKEAQTCTLMQIYAHISSIYVYKHMYAQNMFLSVSNFLIKTWMLLVYTCASEEMQISFDKSEYTFIKAEKRVHSFHSSNTWYPFTHTCTCMHAFKLKMDTHVNWKHKQV